MRYPGVTDSGIGVSVALQVYKGKQRRFGQSWELQRNTDPLGLQIDAWHLHVLGPDVEVAHLGSV